MQTALFDTLQKHLYSSAANGKEGAGDEAAASNEANLVRAAQSGDQAAMQILLSRQERVLMSVCHGILGDATEAEDAVQETFLHALRALSRPNGFRGEAAFRTWLMRIGLMYVLVYGAVVARLCHGRKCPQAYRHPKPAPSRRLWHECVCTTPYPLCPRATAPC